MRRMRRVAFECHRNAAAAAATFGLMLSLGGSSGNFVGFDGGLRGGEARDGHAEGRAGHVVQALAVEEVHRGGVSAVLPADAHLELGARRPPVLGAHLDELPHALLVQHLEGVVLEDALLEVGGQELGHVVARVPVRHLGQVVGAEREELRLLRDLRGEQRGAGDLNHGPDAVRHHAALLRKHLGCRLADHGVLVLELRYRAHQRHHDVGLHADPLRLHLARRLQDGTHLHAADLRVRDGQAAPAEPQHGVHLRQLLDALHHLALRGARVRGQARHDLVQVAVGQELVQRGVQQADGHRAPAHDAEDALEVAALEGQQVVQRLLARLGVRRHDHAPHATQALAGAEEHVLGADQADALGAVSPCRHGVLRRVGVGQHLERAVRVHPGHELPEVAADGGGRQLGGAADHLARGAVQRHPVALVQLHAAEGKPAVLLVHDELGAAGHARLAPAARHHRGVAGHAPARRQDALRRVHAAHVLGGGVHAHQDALLALRVQVLSRLRVEHHLPHGGAGGGRQAHADDVRGVRSLVLELRVQQLVDVRGLHDLDGLLDVDHALRHQVHGNLHGPGARALAPAGLQHVQLPLLHRELDVLHVAVVLLQQLRVADQVLKRVRQRLLHGEDVLGRADARHHVLALRVHQVLTVQQVLARGGVAGEAHARARGVAHVSEHHGLDVDRRALQPGDPRHRHVLLGAVTVPAVEHRVRRQLHLLEGLLREGLAGLLVHSLVLGHQRAQVGGAQLVVLLHAHLALQRGHLVLEQVVVDAHDDVAVHVEEAAVAVERKLLASLDGQPLYHVVVEAEVEHGVHHAGHGDGGAGAHGQQQRVRGVAQLLAHALLDEHEALEHLLPHAVRQVAAVVVELRARLRRHREPSGDGEANGAHLGEVCALAAKQGLHGGVSVGLAIAEGEHALDAHGGGGGGGGGGGDRLGDDTECAAARYGNLAAVGSERQRRGCDGRGSHDWRRRGELVEVVAVVEALRALRCVEA
mmetsp:Transcript_6723/g.17216  ORF Transcript_6723/g.17216 Transcript_6723/m.17216 type:complete len:986 (-) Transcript_6723:44-3001(-)